MVLNLFPETPIGQFLPGQSALSICGAALMWVNLDVDDGMSGAGSARRGIRTPTPTGCGF
jgi:hypothetical protein